MRQTAFFDVYDTFRKHFSDIITERYAIDGRDKWVRFNFTGCNKSGVAIQIKATKDNKIVVCFAKEFMNFLPTCLTLHANKGGYKGYSIKLNASTDSESFFSMLREAVDKFASQQGTAEETAEEI